MREQSGDVNVQSKMKTEMEESCINDADDIIDVTSSNISSG